MLTVQQETTGTCYHSQQQHSRPHSSFFSMGTFNRPVVILQHPEWYIEDRSNSTLAGRLNKITTLDSRDSILQNYNSYNLSYPQGYHIREHPLLNKDW